MAKEKKRTPAKGRVAAPTPKPAGEGRQIKIRIPKKDLPAPEGMNYAHLVQVGTDVQMMVGYLDLDRLRDAINGEDENPWVDLEVSHRFSMSLRGFALIHSQANDLAEKMKAMGVQLDHISKPIQPDKEE